MRTQNSIPITTTMSATEAPGLIAIAKMQDCLDALMAQMSKKSPGTGGPSDCAAPADKVAVGEFTFIDDDETDSSRALSPSESLELQRRLHGQTALIKHLEDRLTDQSAVMRRLDELENRLVSQSALITRIETLESQLASRVNPALDQDAQGAMGEVLASVPRTEEPGASPEEASATTSKSDDVAKGAEALITAKDTGAVEEEVKEKSYEIVIKRASGAAFSLQVQPTDTIEDVKTQIQDQEGLRLKQQRLDYAGRQLKDDKTLLDSKISPGSTLLLTILFAEPLPILVQVCQATWKDRTTFEGAPGYLELYPFDTTEDITAQIAQYSGVPSRRIQLGMDNGMLRPGRTLMDYNVQRNAVLRLYFAPVLSIRLPTGNTVIVDTVQYYWESKHVKDELQRVAKVQADRQCLLFNGKALKDSESLFSQGVCGDVTLDLSIALTLKIELPEGSMTINQVHPFAKVSDLRAAIKNSKKNLPSSWRLTFHDKDLDDNQTLAERFIVNDAKLVVKNAKLVAKVP